MTKFQTDVQQNKEDEFMALYIRKVKGQLLFISNIL